MSAGAKSPSLTTLLRAFPCFYNPVFDALLTLPVITGHRASKDARDGLPSPARGAGARLFNRLHCRKGPLHKSGLRKVGPELARMVRHENREMLSRQLILVQVAKKKVSAEGVKKSEKNVQFC